MCVDELPGHPHVSAGLVDEGEVEGDLPLQIHLIVRHALQGRAERERASDGRKRGEAVSRLLKLGNWSIHQRPRYKGGKCEVTMTQQNES